MIPILVTGGAKGLGAAICKTLAQKGHDLVIHYRFSEKEAHEVAAECQKAKVQASIIQGDFSSSMAVEDFIGRYNAQFGLLKGLVNNVGNYLIAPPTATNVISWEELFQTNVFAPIALTQAFLPSLKQHRGSVVNIGVVGLQGAKGMTKATAYAASKSALFFYTRALAKELASENIRVNMVSPGYLENAVDLPQLSHLPLKRAAYLSEVSEVVAMFFDPAFDYITGQNLEIAGGIGL